MENEDKFKVLQDVYELQWCEQEPELQLDLVKFTTCVMEGVEGAWYTEDAFIDYLMDEFSDNHPLWAFIKLED